MFYNYDERIDELDRISKIPYCGIKEKALRKFIAEEEEILRSLKNPSQRSQALDSAIKMLNTLENPPAQAINPKVARALF